MSSEYLSETELFFSPYLKEDSIIISGEEYNHLVKVMRHKENDLIWITAGKGEIYECRIENIKKNEADAAILKSIQYTNPSEKYFLCIPHLKNHERLEFALEKCTELGITNFIIYHSERTLFRTPRKERWEKIITSAMKQSLRSYLPQITILELKEILMLEGMRVIFDQRGEREFHKNLLDQQKKHYFLIGPEGGFSSAETDFLKDSDLYFLAPNRLRSETAAILAASLLI